MDKIADQLEKDFNESELENVSEDIETLRQILDNLVKISFSQEEVMKSTQKVNARSASVSDLMTRQFRVKNNMKIIEDSLNALARRQTSVRPFIQTEVSKIQDYLLSSQTDLQDRKVSQASKNQQFVLTSMNNLKKLGYFLSFHLGLYLRYLFNYMQNSGKLFKYFSCSNIR